MIAWWTEYFDQDGKLIQRVRTYDHVHAQVEFAQMRKGALEDNIPEGTARIDLIRGHVVQGTIERKDQDVSLDR